jgi:hypothetical protein
MLKLPPMVPTMLVESLMLRVLLYAPSISRKKFNVVVQLMAPVISGYVVIQLRLQSCPRRAKKHRNFEKV